MKNNQIQKAALPYLIIGVLLVTASPAIGRYYQLPDFETGFLTGLGLMLETVAIIRIRKEKGVSCWPKIGKSF